MHMTKLTASSTFSDDMPINAGECFYAMKSSRPYILLIWKATFEWAKTSEGPISIPLIMN